MGREPTRARYTFRSRVRPQMAHGLCASRGGTTNVSASSARHIPHWHRVDLSPQEIENDLTHPRRIVAGEHPHDPFAE